MWRRIVSISSVLSSATRRSSCSSSSYQITFGQKFGEQFSTEISTQGRSKSSSEDSNPFITFVLGGPGTGKGTQCAKIVENFGFIHLSAGELLRREISSNSENGAKILKSIKDGKIVPSELSVKLIQREMQSSKNNRFLIDGFPRSEENRITFEQIVGVEPSLVLFFDCSEEEMVQRVLSRNEGRVDDNIDTIKKRLQVFSSLSLPVVDYYARKGKLHKINALGTVDEIFEQVRPLFATFEEP